MYITEEDKKIIQSRFNCYMKKVVSGIAKDYYKNKIRNANIERLDYLDEEIPMIISADYTNQFDDVDTDIFLKILNKIQYDVIKLYIVYRFTEKEIAEQLNVSQQYVNKVKKVAISQLKKYYFR